MLNGAFKSFRHEHRFIEYGSGTLMTDIFDYVSPLGVLGEIADALFLYTYMKALLIKRNAIIKEYAENNIVIPINSNHSNWN